LGCRREELHELALFAGAGGGLLGGILVGFRPICYVEWDKYCARVIEARIKEGSVPEAPIWDDAQTFDPGPWAGKVDIVTGGFPCQPFSSAGKRLGENDPRNMWPATFRIISGCRPPWCLLENVNAIIGPYFGRVLIDLAGIGYDVRWGVLSAGSAGAPHLRRRVWILCRLADAIGDGDESGSRDLGKAQAEEEG
jgi:DNA (cytosine-5)-methyltransferase 1